jgi:hypothetical protein
MFTNLAYNMSRFIPHGNLGVDHFKVTMYTIGKINSATTAAIILIENFNIMSSKGDSRRRSL